MVERHVLDIQSQLNPNSSYWNILWCQDWFSLFDIATSLITYIVYIIPFIRATSLSLRYGDRVEPWLTGMKRSGAGMLQETLLRKNLKVNSIRYCKKPIHFLCQLWKSLQFPWNRVSSCTDQRWHVRESGFWATDRARRILEWTDYETTWGFNC